MTSKKRTPAKQDALNRRLVVAINGFMLDEARRLLKEGADPNYRQVGDEPLISFAAGYDTPAVVQLLLDHGADIHVYDKAGQTPLGNALENAEFDSALLLMKHGADINQQPVKGESVPPFAVGIIADRYYQTTERTEFILQHAPDLFMTFTHNKQKGCTVAQAMASFLESCDDRHRDIIVELCQKIDTAIANSEQVQAEARMKVLRDKHQSDLRRKSNGKFKL